MQSTQTQHMQAIINALHKLREDCKQLSNIMHNTSSTVRDYVSLDLTPMQTTQITFLTLWKLALVMLSIKNTLCEINIIQKTTNSTHTPTHLQEALTIFFDYANLELSNGLNNINMLCAINVRSESGCNIFYTKCLEFLLGFIPSSEYLNLYTKDMIKDILNHIKGTHDIEAVSTREARAQVDTQESEKMATQSQACKRKAEPQSLEDEPVSSKHKNDTQSVVAESAYKPDTMLSSATISSSESKVALNMK